MIIDFHTHVEYKAGRPALHAGGVRGRHGRRRNRPSRWSSAATRPTPATRPAWADPAVMGAATNFDDDAVAAYCAEYPDRLIGFGSIHPDRYQPERKVRAGRDRTGPARASSSIRHAGFYPNDPRLAACIGRCEELGVPVVIHTGVKAVRWQRMKYNRPIYVDDVATNFPKLEGGHVPRRLPLGRRVPGRGPLEPERLGRHQFPGLHGAGVPPRRADRRGAAEPRGRDRGRTAACGAPKGPYMDLPLYGAHGPEDYARSRRVSRANGLIFSAPRRRRRSWAATRRGCLGLES